MCHAPNVKFDVAEYAPSPFGVDMLNSVVVTAEHPAQFTQAPFLLNCIDVLKRVSAQIRKRDFANLSAQAFFCLTIRLLFQAAVQRALNMQQNPPELRQNNVLMPANASSTLEVG